MILSKQEKLDLIDEFYCGDPIEFMEHVERAVLDKAMPALKQEPVAYGIYAENGNIKVWWRNQFDDQAVSFDQAKEWCESNGVKFCNLVSLYDHSTLPQAAAIPEGYVLLPVEATPQICQYFIAYDGTSYSNPLDFTDFKKDWERMASEALKPDNKI